jgi:predicted secreted hydrolase
MGNFALTDVDSRQFHASDRFERQALDLAGATASPFHVWIGDWTIRSIGAETFPVRLRARHHQISIDLVLDQGMAPVLEGDRGLSQKGPEAGQASYYYSLPRMPTRGAIEIAGRTYRAEGTSWMDREWSTSSLGKEQVGWDWFALQFSEGSCLMYYQLRGSTGEPGPFSSGVWIDKEGRTNPLSREDVGLQISSWWASPIDQRRFPAGWHLRIARLGLDVEVTPFLPNQELNLAVRYWEGAVRVTGTSAAVGRIAGVGYAELTGY